MLEARIPSGPIEQKWDKCRYEMKLMNPANRRKHSIIVVGAGLAGAAAAATLGHFRVESQTPEGEAKRDDANFAYTAAWEWRDLGQSPAVHKEPLTFEYVPLSQRSYK